VFVCILPEKAIPEMTYTVSGGTLNPTCSLTHSSYFCRSMSYWIQLWCLGEHCALLQQSLSRNWICFLALAFGSMCLTSLYIDTCFPVYLRQVGILWTVQAVGKDLFGCWDSGTSWLRSGFSIANQIKFDLRFTDFWSTWSSELIVDQQCFVLPCIFDLQLRDRRLADPPSTEPTLRQSDWLTMTSICGVVLNYPACAASGRHSQ